MIELLNIRRAWVPLTEDDHELALKGAEEKLQDKRDKGFYHDRSSLNAPKSRLEGFTFWNVNEIAAARGFDAPWLRARSGQIDLVSNAGMKIEVKGSKSDPDLYPGLTAGKNLWDKNAEVGLKVTLKNKRWAQLTGWLFTREFYEWRDWIPGKGQRQGYYLVNHRLRDIGTLFDWEVRRGGSVASFRRCGVCNDVVMCDAVLCPEHEKRGGQLRFL